MCPTFPLFGGGGEGVEPPIKFSKRGGLTGPPFFFGGGGVAGEEG